MASPAHHSCVRKGRSSGKKCGSHCLVLVPARGVRGFLFMNAFFRFGRFARPREVRCVRGHLQFHDSGVVPVIFNSSESTRSAAPPTNTFGWWFTRGSRFLPESRTLG